MFGFGAIGQFAIGQVDTGATAAEFIGPDKYMQALSLPVRIKPGLKASQQQFSALSDPFPFVSFSWFEELSKPPVLTKSGLKTTQQQFIAYHPAPSPFVATGWFEPLSEPVRFKRALRPSLQKFFTTDTSVIPLQELIEWFAALSEPVRIRPGLRAWLQQFLAAPSQLRPNPTTTGRLSALETPDSFLGGARSWNRVISGEIGVIVNNFTGAQIGVITDVPVSGTSGVVDASTPPVSGSAMAAVTTAKVSIRIV